MNTRQTEHTLGTISSLDALPCDLKKQLEHISILAYKGMINKKLVFTQDELSSILPSEVGSLITRFLSCILPATATATPAQDLPAMGMLQKVQWAGSNNKAISYNFVHHSIQEMLAAYRISQMGYFEQVRVFRTLLSKPRFAAVLQFYAGFTKLTNRRVRNIITGRDFNGGIALLSCIRCFFEAQINDQSLYEKISQRLRGNLHLDDIALSPLDCLSVGYFLSFVLRNSRKLNINLVHCSIDDHSFGLMMGELSKACPAVKVAVLNITNNKITAGGIATGLQANTTLKTICVGGETTTDEEALSLAAASTENTSIECLRLYWLSTHPESTLKEIGECVRTST